MASVKQSWINKYGMDLGLKMWEDKKKLSACSLDSFIKKHGNETGTLKFNQWKENLRKSKTLVGYVEKYGKVEGERRYNEKNKKLSVSEKALRLNGKTDEEIKKIRDTHSKKSIITLDSFKEKYGNDLGEKRWNDRIQKSKISSKRCLDYWIIKNNGNVELAKSDLASYQRRDKNFYINRYGEIRGLEKYEEAKKKRFLGGFIEPCSKFQSEVENYLSDNFDIKIHTHKNPYCFFTNGKLEQSVVIPDILISEYKLIIECFGDYWHCNPEKYNSEFLHSVINKSAKQIWENDEKRIKFLNDSGYEVVVIWEKSWKNNIDVEKERIIYEISKKRNN